MKISPKSSPAEERSMMVQQQFWISTPPAKSKSKWKNALKPRTPNFLSLNSSTTTHQHLHPSISSKINPNATKLDPEHADIFHKFTAKNSFLSQRSHLDIMSTVAFLCTRVKAPDEDDWKKLLCLSICLKCTKRFHLTLQADNSHIVQRWADTAFAVHPDMKSHTRAAMTMGKGAIQAISTKQKINTKSSWWQQMTH